MTQGQDPALGLFEPPTIGHCPWTPAIHIPLQSLPTLLKTPILLDVLYKMAEGEFGSLVQVINKDIKQDCSQY